MNRRRSLGWAVAALATAAGVGGAQWQRRRAAAAAPDPVWDRRFETPQGGSLALAALRGQPLLLNFWATWCPPCVRELPLLDRFRSDPTARGWQVVGLAIDQREPVLQFLQRQPLGLPIGLAAAGGVELSRQLGNATGALPFTAVFDSAGRLAERKLGVIEAGDLQTWVASVH